MKKLRLKRNTRALVIVAHPDDETIWMGGTILKNPEVNWTIFSLCRIHDPDRAPKFFKVCKLYRAKGIMTDLEDEGKLGIKKLIPLAKKLIQEKIGCKKFDYIFTHGPNGEYGHPRHIGVHRAVKQLVQNKKLKTAKIFYFNYRVVKDHKLKAKKNTDYLLKLNKKELKQKKDIMSNFYGFMPEGIDTGYCTNNEAFKVNTD